MSVTVVVPTYNERDNLPELVERLRRAVPSARLLVVDDASPDGTGDLAAELGRRLGGIDLLRRPGKQGLASAYVQGFRRALSEGAERVVQMDADLSHDPEDVPRLLAGLDEGLSVVLGSRYVDGGGVRNWPLHRLALSRFGSAYARWWLGLPLRDLTGGFKAWSAPALQAVLERPVRSEGYAFQVEMTWRAVRCGFPVGEVPIVFTERVAGSSKMSTAIALEAAWLVPAIRLRG